MALGTWRAKLFGHDNRGNQLVNTFTFSMDDTGAVVSPYDSAVSFINAWDVKFTALWFDCMPTDYILDFLVGQRIDPGNTSAAAIITTSVTPAHGTFGSASIVSSIGMQLAYITNVAKIIGKTFLPSIPAGAIVESVMQAAYVTACGAFLASVGTGVSIVGFTALTAHASVWSKATSVATFVAYGLNRVKASGRRKRLLPLY